MADFQDIKKQQEKKDRAPSFDVLSRRFFREVQQSRILSEAKRQRFHEKNKISRKLRRESARRKAQRWQQRRGW